MQFNFDNVDVAVNRSGILSTNSSINTNNSIEAAYVLGYSRPINQLPFGSIKTTFNSTYFPVINQEPNFAVVNKIKSMINDSGYLGERVEFAGLHHDYWFLDSYSLKVQPNNIVETTVNYSTFWQLCGGTLRPKSNQINYLDQGSCMHSWSTYILSSGDYMNKPIYDFSYSFQANWRPIYIIGKKFPVEVKLLGASETISFNTDEYRAVLFTGENVYPNLLDSNNGNIQFRNISIICMDGCDSTGDSSASLNLNVSGFKIKSITPVVQVGQTLRVTYLAEKYY